MGRPVGTGAGEGLRFGGRGRASLGDRKTTQAEGPMTAARAPVPASIRASADWVDSRPRTARTRIDASAGSRTPMLIRACCPNAITALSSLPAGRSNEWV
jgi:hypothetical protein